MNEIEKKMAAALSAESVRYEAQYGVLYEPADCRSKYPCRYGNDYDEDAWGDGVVNDLTDTCYEEPCEWLQDSYAKYVLDFAVFVGQAKIAVEVDGYGTHRAHPSMIADDFRRQREIEADGWEFIRFTGSEVHSHADRCARKVAKRVQEIRASREQPPLLL